MTTCPKCGKTVPGNVRHCAYCGAHIPPLAVQWLQRVDWRFLSRWVAVSLLFCGLAWLALTHPALSDLWQGSMASPLQALLAGAIVALGQWLVLRQPAHDRRAWLLALPAGWLLAFGLTNAWTELSTSYTWLQQTGAAIVPLAVIGGLIGYLQWPLARHYAWPARLWVLASALPPAGAAVLLALGLAGGTEGGWFLKLALQVDGGPAFASIDLVVATLMGFALGAGQFLLMRRSTALAPLLPLTCATGALFGALAVDLLFQFAQSMVTQFGSPGIMVPWYDFAGGPAGAAVAWGMIGIGLGAGDWILLRVSTLLPPLPGRPAIVAARPEGPGRAWLPLTAAGGAAGALIAWPLMANGVLLLGATTAGLLVGLPQWLATQPDFKRAGWLPITNAASWSVLAVAPTLVGAPPLLQSSFGLPLFTVVLALLPGFILALRR